MEASGQQSHEITIYSNRKLLFLGKSIITLAFLFIVGLDVLVWTSIDWDYMDIGAYVAAMCIFSLLLLICSLCMGWVTFLTLYKLRWRGPIITITTRGLYINFPLRFNVSPRVVKMSFIPWEEIEWLSRFDIGRRTLLTLSFKDPARYWSLYGQGKYRRWRRDALTDAHFSIDTFTLSLSASQILQRIEENYRAELIKYEVQLKY